MRSPRLQAGGQTGLVACASIASFPFTQLIQQPGAEQSIDPYPSARGAEHRDQDTHRIARLKWQGATKIHGPRTCFIIQPTLLSVVLTKTLGGFATSLSLFIADHHLSGAIFLSLFTKHDASPTCMEEAHLHRLAGIILELSSKTQSNVVTRPIAMSFALLRDGQVALGRFQAEDVDPYQSGRAVGSSLRDATLVLD